MSWVSTTLLTVVLAGAPVQASPADSSPRSAGLRAVGIGYPPRGMQNPRARLMARRAAEVTAARNLAWKVDPTGRTNLPPFRYVGTRYLAQGAVEVTVELRAAPAGVPHPRP